MPFEIFEPVGTPGVGLNKRFNLPVAYRGRLKPPNRRKKPGMTPDSTYRKTPEMRVDFHRINSIYYVMISPYTFSLKPVGRINKNSGPGVQDAGLWNDSLISCGHQPVGLRLNPAQFGLDSLNGGNIPK